MRTTLLNTCAKTSTKKACLDVKMIGKKLSGDFHEQYIFLVSSWFNLHLTLSQLTLVVFNLLVKFNFVWQIENSGNLARCYFTGCRRNSFSYDDVHDFLIFSRFLMIIDYLKCFPTF